MPQVPYKAVPEERELPSSGSGGVRVQTNLEAFGGGVAAAIGSAGQMAEHAGNELFQRAIALQQLKNETEATEADAKYMMAVGEVHAKYNALEGKDAVAAYPQYIKDIQGLRQQTRDGLTNDMVRKMFDRQSLSTMSRTIFNGAGHAASQQKQWTLNAATAQMELDTKSVENNPKDDIQFQEKLRRVEANAQQIATVKGLDDVSAKALTLKATSSLWASRIIAQSRTEPFQAAKVLDEQKTNLTQADYMKVDNAVRAQGRAVGSVNIANEVYAAGQETDKAPAKSLAQMEAEAEARAKKLNPEDPILAKQAVEAVRGKYNQDRYAKSREVEANTQIVAQGIQAGVKDIQQLRTNPKVAAAIDALPPDKQNAIPGQINRYNDARDKVSKEENFIRLKGLMNNDVTKFLETDITKEGLSQTDMKYFMNQREKLMQNPSGDPRVSRAMGWLRGAIGSQLQAAGVFRRTNNNAEEFDQFTGALQTALETYQEDNKRPADYQTVVEKIAPQVLKTVKEPGMLWGTNDVPFFKQKVPSEFEKAITADVVAKGGVEPTPEQIQRAYIRMQYNKLYSKPASTEKPPLGFKPK